MSTDYPPQYVDPRYWNPECKNFELIDWDKWYATNPQVPKVFDPPQRKNGFQGLGFAPLWYWNRSWYCQPLAFILRPCCAAKPEMERISDGDVIFKKLLDPKKTSSDAPLEFKNHLLWTENNYAPETLINLGSWAWRKQTTEGRVIGMGSMDYDWTSDATVFAYFFSYAIANRTTVVQASPDGKWYALITMSDPGPESLCKYVFIYVVQEGDSTFETNGGKDIDHVKPGDLVRMTWDLDNPYETNDSKLQYMYFPRRVASIDSDGLLVKNSPHYEDLLEAATRDPSDYCCQTCCYTCACCISGPERVDFQVKHVSDRQTFRCSAVPPTGEFIDRKIGEGEDEFDDNPERT